MGERVFKRRIRGRDGKIRHSKVWYAWVPKPGGGVKRVTTLCADKQAALVVAARLERASVDPDYAAQNEAETAGVLSAYLASRKRLGRAEGTLHHVSTKSGHLIRLLPARLAGVTHAAVETYIDTRLAEGAQRTTIKKETRVLKAALRLAAKNNLFTGDPENVIPELEDDYEPRTRFLTPWELVALVNALGSTTARAGIVVFIVATSARWGEACRFDGHHDVTREEGLAFVSLRGTKTKASTRTVPVMGVGLTLLDWSLDKVNRHWPKWQNVRRDLAAACARAGIEAVTPNDLRRTFATWLQQAGAGNDLIAKAMGHVDTRMVERVYGRMTPGDLARLLKERTDGQSHRGDGGAHARSPGDSGPMRTPEAPESGEQHVRALPVEAGMGRDAGDESCPGEPEDRDGSNHAGRAERAGLRGDCRRPLSVGLLMAKNYGDTGLDTSISASLDTIESSAKQAVFAVPRDGIEPPTRGFSIRHAKTHDSSGKQAESCDGGTTRKQRWPANGRRSAWVREATRNLLTLRRETLRTFVAGSGPDEVRP